MELRFRSIRELDPGPKWKAFFDQTWPAYHAWFLREGDAARPSFLTSRRMLETHMPELVPMWQRLTELSGGTDQAARLLSLYRPTPYLSGCSQAVFGAGGDGARLVRNYDYRPDLCEGLLLYSAWHGTKVIAMSDCLWGVLDGINERGLAVSLAFGGRKIVGDGFGVPLVLRFILEFCGDTREATEVLARVPSHMAYNVSVVDARGDFATVEVGPDRAAIVSRDRVATNHQRDAVWEAHAERTRTVERRMLLEAHVSDPVETGERFVRRFLEPPLYVSDYANALGTLYTAVYAPAPRAVEIVWPDGSWKRSFEDFEEGERLVTYPNDGIVHQVAT